MRQKEINDGMTVVGLSTFAWIGESLGNGCLRSRLLHFLRPFSSKSGTERFQSTRSRHDTDSNANTEADMQIASDTKKRARHIKRLSCLHNLRFSSCV